MPTKHVQDLIAGVDPGLSSGGIVVICPPQRNRVLRSVSLVPASSVKRQADAQARSLLQERDGWGDREFTSAWLRAVSWAGEFERALKEIREEFGPVACFAIESFVDQRSRAREEQNRLVRNRWHTPLVMGMMAEKLDRYGATVENRRVVYQNAGIVIRQWSQELAELKSRGRSVSTDIVVPGDGQIGNDHERKALVHALALSLRKNFETDKRLHETTTR